MLRLACCIGTSNICGFANNIIHFTNKLLDDFWQFAATETMCTEVASMEGAYAICLNFEGISIKGRMIYSHRHDFKISPFELFAWLKGLHSLQAV